MSPRSAAKAERTRNERPVSGWNRPDRARRWGRGVHRLTAVGLATVLLILVNLLAVRLNIEWRIPQRHSVLSQRAQTMMASTHPLRMMLAAMLSAMSAEGTPATRSSHAVRRPPWFTGRVSSTQT